MHYLVAVFTKENQTVEELLQPYQENGMGGVDAKYLEFKDCTDEVREEYEEDNRGCSTFEEYVEEHCDYEEYKNKLGYWENPNGKWDWYLIGGRWIGQLRLKPGATSGQRGERSWCNEKAIMPEDRYDSALIKDIDFTPNEEELNKYARTWDLKMRLVEPKDEEEKATADFGLMPKEIMVEKFKTKENYVRACSLFSTYAVITPDGRWHETDGGFFGVTKWDEEFAQRFLETADPEWRLTLVDIHS